jgi:hypothetical protein
MIEETHIAGMPLGVLHALTSRHGSWGAVWFYLGRLLEFRLLFLTGWAHGVLGNASYFSIVSTYLIH